MDAGKSIVNFSLTRPRFVAITTVVLTVVLLMLAGLPTLWPDTFKGLNSLKIDTDPENMLPEDEPVRVFHNHMKGQMDLHDMVVVGVVNSEHSDGVFNPDSLSKIHELTEYAASLQWPDPADPEAMAGVIEQDIIAPSRVDSL